MMKMNRVTTVEKLKLSSSFETLRNMLYQGKYDDRLDKQLKYWALPNERRLPMVLLDRTLREILNTTFSELKKTAGVGRNKLNTLIKLLARATKNDSMGDALSEETTGHDASDINSNERDDQQAFEPGLVSDAVWQTWCDRIVKANIAHLNLGQLTPSLLRLTTVSWELPLSEYIGVAVHDIPKKKTHGLKRVHSILETFNHVNEMIQRGDVEEGNPACLKISLFRNLEKWLQQKIKQQTQLYYDEIVDQIFNPLMNQFRIDLGQDVAALVETRLGVGCEKQAVRFQSQKLGVTRARVYQLLDDCSKVFQIRWPEGKKLMLAMKRKLNNGSTDLKTKKLFTDLFGILYPKKQEDIASQGQLAITMNGMEV